MRLSPRPTVFAIIVATGMGLLRPAEGRAQQPAGADTTVGDSALVTLPEITVTVTRNPEPLARVPAAVSVLDRSALRRGQATLGLDEALANLPGVYVVNRYNYSLDQRLSIRGFGSRSNFGLRGVKVLLDGIPQTLPDGQSQLTNVDLANIDRVEVLRGSASSLYGNASGGVISLFSQAADPAPFAQSLRVEGGSFGLFKLQGRVSARRGGLAGTISGSQTNVQGFRQNSEAEMAQVNLGLDYLASPATTASLRFGYGDAPKAENPGALTFAELRANPDSAAANNILRKADKNVDQEQLALSVRHFGAGGEEYNASVFGLLRDLKNPLANPPLTGTGPNVGTYVDIDREVVGFRLSGSRPLSASAKTPRLMAGIDLQRLRDDRKNSRAVSGVPDTLLLSQIEKVTELGPFIQLLWSPGADWLLSTGTRYDWVRFSVDDHHLSDGFDNSGSRTMKALSGHAGVSFSRSEVLTPYINVSTSFETPTTTELANQPNTTGGFNNQLKPQHGVNLEVGARGRLGSGFSYSIAAFASRITDAIIQFREVGGRAYFQNAGQLHDDGLELGLNAEPLHGLRLFASYTYAHYRFAEYRIVNGATVDTLDGNRLAGVPDGFLRLGLRTSFLKGGTLDIDHTMSSSLYADDANTQLVNGWGARAPTDPNGFGLGVTNVRLAWEGHMGRTRFAPFVAVNNLWDRSYVGSVNLNGTFGRVFEPAPGRNAYAGLEIGWAAR